MRRYLTPIEKHLQKWHTVVFIDDMSEDALVSFKGRVYQTADAPFCRQFINLRGEWRLNDELKNWLEERQIEYILHLNSTTDPYKWSLRFSNKAHAMLFKLTWWEA